MTLLPPKPSCSLAAAALCPLLLQPLPLLTLHAVPVVWVHWVPPGDVSCGGEVAEVQHLKPSSLQRSNGLRRRAAKATQAVGQAREQASKQTVQQEQQQQKGNGSGKASWLPNKATSLRWPRPVLQKP